MKNIINISAVAIMLAAGFSGCKKEYPEPLQDPGSSSESRMVMAVNPLLQGVWEVGSFQWPAGNYRDDFKGYQFVFDKVGLVVATKGSIKVGGKWNVTDNRMMMWFGDQRPLMELNGDRWSIYERSTERVSMKMLSPVNNQVILLTFRRLR